MAIVVTTLEGEDIPQAERRADVTVVYRVVGGDGIAHYFLDDVEAARKAVELSESK